MTTATAPSPAPSAGLGSLAGATPAHRDRTVDAVRALCIVVVVLWHWVFSITHVRADGALSMPNPVDEIPAGWLLTWALQVMPAFFVVGGFANRASWERLERDGAATWRGFATGRMARLWRPIGVMVAVWAVLDIAAQVLLDAPSVLSWGLVVFVPLWFIATYSAVLLLTPLALRAHRRRPVGTLVGLGLGIAVADALRFGTDTDRWGLVTTALVWIAAHQLGFAWRDGAVVGWSLRARLAVVAAAAATLAVLTSVGPYPASMVALRGAEVSNMFPTTAPVAVLAVLQLGLISLVRPSAERLLARRGPWTAVIGVNAVAMTVFAWHMTALVAVIGALRLARIELPAETSGTWWALRPLWLIAPGLVLAGLVRVFARVELAPVLRPARATMSAWARS